jgi:cyclopropane fatty-acyl-phospholipid synthase-like methyltransferase
MIFTGERPTYEDESSIKRSLERYKTALKFIPTSPFPLRIIDFGCGIGLGSQVFKREYYHGVDFSEEAIKEAKKLNVIATFEKIFNINQLSFISVSFKYDFFLCLEVLEHLEKEEVIELLQILSKTDNYTGYITTPNGDLYPYHPETVEQRIGHHKWHYTYNELKELFSVFKNAEIFGIEYDSNIKQFVTYGIYWRI